MVHLLGAFSNTATGVKVEELRQLRSRILANAPSDPPPRSAVPPRHGEVQQTIVKILAQSTGPRTVAEIRIAVEESLGKTVAKSTVSNCLATQSQGERALFKRVKRGWYSAS